MNYAPEENSEANKDEMRKVGSPTDFNGEDDQDNDDDFFLLGGIHEEEGEEWDIEDGEEGEIDDGEPNEFLLKLKAEAERQGIVIPPYFFQKKNPPEEHPNNIELERLANMLPEHNKDVRDEIRKAHKAGLLRPKKTAT